MQYYKARYVPNNLTFVVVGDVDARRSAGSNSPDFFKDYPAQIAQAGLHPGGTAAARPARSAPGIRHRTDPALAGLAHPGGHASGRSRARSALGNSGRRPQFAALSPGARRGRLAYGVSAFSYTPGEPGMFGIDATVDPEKREPAQELILQDRRRRSKQTGVTAEELAKAKKMSLSHQLGALYHHARPGSDIGSNWLLTRNLNFTPRLSGRHPESDARRHSARRRRNI